MIIRSLSVVLALAANTYATNLLTNPGFEDQSLNDPGSFSIIEDWGKIGSGSAVIRNSNVVTSPLINNVLSLQPGSGAVQTFASSLLPETTYRITLDYQGAAGRSFSYGVGLGSGSGGSSVITDYELPEDVFAVGGDGPGDSFLFIPSSGAGSISFEFTTGNFGTWEWDSAAFWIQSNPANPAGALLFDNLSVGAVPEPSAGLLVAAGAVLLLSQRRVIKGR